MAFHEIIVGCSKLRAPQLFTDCGPKGRPTFSVWDEELNRVALQLVWQNTQIFKLESCNKEQSSPWSKIMNHKAVQSIWSWRYGLPSSDTKVSTDNALTSSRLNILGVGRGNGTLFNKNSLGEAMAWKKTGKQSNTNGLSIHFDPQSHSYLSNREGDLHVPWPFTNGVKHQICLKNK